MRQCGAKTKGGGICKQAALQNGRCHYHGGKSLAGIASPRYIEGKYSKVIPARLAGNYAAAQADMRLLELRDEVALIDARLLDLLSRVDTGESGAIWADLKKRRMELQAAQKANDTLGQIGALNAILTLIDQGYTDYRAWGEVASTLEQRRRLVESERKRLTEMQQTITAERAMLLLGAVVGVIQQHVHDRAALAGITTGIQKLIEADA